MFGLWQGLRAGIVSRYSPEDPHWRETVRMFRVWEELPLENISGGSSEDSRWRDVLVPRVRENLQSEVFTSDTQEDPHGGKTVQMLRL